MANALKLAGAALKPSARCEVFEFGVKGDKTMNRARQEAICG
jgi:hypothetical protein